MACRGLCDISRASHGNSLLFCYLPLLFSMSVLLSTTLIDGLLLIINQGLHSLNLPSDSSSSREVSWPYPGQADGLVDRAQSVDRQSAS